jgi:hypothetical protein
MEHELLIPLSMKAHRAPIPFDFKHPVSTNTVPAGLFKEIADANHRTFGGSRANANVNPAFRTSGSSKYCSSVIYLHLRLLMLTNTFTDIIGQGA